MPLRPLCVTNDRPGTDDPQLLKILADAEARAGQSLAGSLAVMYNHDGQLLATWFNGLSRDKFAASLTGAWQDAMDGASILNLIPSDDGYDYQEDVMDSPVE